ncbi:hypothetical protein HXP36_12925 [Ralstonia solanacearum]|nr:hypothetical protein [Ralstonia solanacearum]
MSTRKLLVVVLERDSKVALRTAVAPSGLSMKATSSRFIVFTKRPAMPFCGLQTGVVNGFRPISVANARVFPAR